MAARNSARACGLKWTVLVRATDQPRRRLQMPGSAIALAANVDFPYAAILSYPAITKKSNKSSTKEGSARGLLPIPGAPSRRKIPGEAKAEVVIGDVGIKPESKGRPEIGRDIEPRPAANDV
uniref:Uncharacterized protein n=1 Tax=Candidatus Kentrum sp. LFY TaxID=2126342 RepID=A0A450UEB0_9GAMM|nr:MAG: hypothetical protein BECKLFY1418A_GA0070994_101315 [Candidatus Kentron sp. LFY]